MNISPKALFGALEKFVGLWSNYKKRKHDEAVSVGVSTIRHHIEMFPDPGQQGWKVKTRTEWIAMIPRLPDNRVSDDVLTQLKARIISQEQDGKIYVMIDLR